VFSFVSRSPRPPIIDTRLSGLIVSAPLLIQPKETRPNAWLIRAGHLLGKMLPSLQFNAGVASENISRDPEVVAKNRADPFCSPIGTVRHTLYVPPSPNPHGALTHAHTRTV
jgi:alpha-beta hydrolase superfamily lysophospholipase